MTNTGENSLTHNQTIAPEQGAFPGLEGILQALIHNDEILANFHHISLAELLKRLESEDFSFTAKLTILGLAVSEILRQSAISDFQAFFSKSSSPLIKPRDVTPKPISDQRSQFIRKYRIKRTEMMLLKHVIEGFTLKKAKEMLGISSSTANKKIRNLWLKLGLKNREQLIFVAGWMRLFSFDLECLEADEEGHNYPF